MKHNFEKLVDDLSNLREFSDKSLDLVAHVIKSELKCINFTDITMRYDGNQILYIESFKDIDVKRLGIFKMRYSANFYRQYIMTHIVVEYGEETFTVTQKSRNWLLNTSYQKNGVSSFLADVKNYLVRDHVNDLMDELNKLIIDVFKRELTV